MSWMKESFNKSMADMVTQVTDNVLKNISPHLSGLDQPTPIAIEAPEGAAFIGGGHLQGSSLEGRSVELRRDSPESDGELSTTSSTIEDSAFNTDLVEPLIKALRKTLDLEDKLQSPTKKDKMFKSIAKKNHLFPIHEFIKKTVDSEWENPDRKFTVSRRFRKMFPFPSDQSKAWEFAPKVDAAITRVARRTTLPVDEGVSLRDPMERRQDASLKRAYVAGGATCKAAVAITSVTRANNIWLQELEEAIKKGEDRSKLAHMLQDIKVANDFVAEASMDVVKLAGKSMSLSVTARRGLWLRHWNADPQSKHNLCSLPFRGNLLFGPELDQIISKMSAGKSPFLPQDRRDGRQVRGRFISRPNFKDAKQYKPGKPFSRQWKPKDQSFPGKSVQKQEKRA
ncbi:lamina-associated polypeptide 2-like [Xenopus laevis]|uniref:Lamina-associated polypeptide 2-like n=1 Tax=Xenopus laevis TaxID=8355 RepID=A0A8J1LFJ2_XENLA|nr:lamina-associated polypeptide 2-like [Xenopus laevis]XP_041428171.1 lamina-associated polypeptide 2-like [Xenopus laevis]